MKEASTRSSTVVLSDTLNVGTVMLAVTSSPDVSKSTPMVVNVLSTSANVVVPPPLPVIAVSYTHLTLPTKA